MKTEEENQALDPEEEALLELAGKVDSGEVEDGDELPDVVSGRTAEDENDEDEDSSPEALLKDAEDDEKDEGRRLKDEDPEAGKPEATEKTEPEKEKSEEQRAESEELEAKKEEPELTEEEKRKGAERYDRTWKQLQEDRDTFRKDRETWERKLAARQEMLDHKEAQLKVGTVYTAEDYEKAAKSFEEQGRYEHAEAARKEAARLRLNPPKQPKFLPAELDPESGEFQRHAQHYLAQVREQYPDISDKSSPLHQRTLDIVAANPIASQVPQGFALASKFAATELRAEKAETQVKELTAEINRLNQRLELNRSPVNERASSSTPAGPKSLDQEESDLAAMAAAADRDGVPLV